MEYHELKMRIAKMSLRRPSRRWLPSPGNMIFTLVIVGVLVGAQFAGILPLRASPLQSGASTGTIAYQGRLADAAGVPLSDIYSMAFRLYDAAEGGTPLWEENWTGSNSVVVSDGLFNVMLGSLVPIQQEIITGNDSLFLGISVGNDDEMTPRVQLGSVPYATQALSVPDDSISTAKLQNLSVTTDILDDGSVTEAKLAPDLNLVPSGTIVMWSGSIETIPIGWALCDGGLHEGVQTPDLRDKFVVGAGNSYVVGATGGEAQHTLTISEIPSHNHGGTTNTTGAHTHGTYIGGVSRANNGSNGTFYFPRTDTHDQNIDKSWTSSSDGNHAHTVSSQGGSQSHENRPPYYGLAFIMKL